ncbi:MAG: histidinol-phosphate transaminase [Thiotrichales bacterium]
MVDLLKHAVPGVQGLHPYVPGKPAEELERELGLARIVKLASNENPLGMSPRAAEAATEALAGLNLYPDDTGFRLKARLAERLDMSSDQITLGAGSSDVLDMVARTFLGPGRNAVFSAHSFAMYAIYTQAMGAEGRVADPVSADDAVMPYGHDLSQMAALVDEQTKVVFIANPNNPTGTWLEETALLEFIEALPKSVIVVLDEAYTEYVKPGLLPDGTKWVEQFPNLIVTRTFSKIYGLAGLRIGYGVAGAELTALINRVRHPFNANSVALRAAEAALEDDDFVARSAALNREGLAQYQKAFHAMGLKVLPSIGNFVCVDFGRSGAELFDQLLRRGVIVRPVGNYGLPDCLRISVGTAEENAICIEALQSVLST